MRRDEEGGSVVIRHATFPGLRLRPTRWGGVYVLAVLVIAGAAINTGNNALMLLLATALGSYIVAGWWSRQVLAKVEVHAAPVRDGFAGQTAAVEVELVNRSRVLPAYGMVLRDHDGAAAVWEPCLEARSSRRHTVELVPRRRGRLALGPWRLEVRLPLGFFVKSKTVLPELEMLVYPRLLPRGATLQVRERGERSATHVRDRGREGDVTQLRAFRDGDESRQIHWKQTARQDHLIVVERESANRAPVFVVVDGAGEPAGDVMTRERFERLLSEAATAIVRRLEQGLAVGLVLGRRVVGPVTGPALAASLLRPLAEVEPDALLESPQPGGRVLGAGRRGSA